MKSTLEGKCQMCSQKINIGDEIVRVASGIWIHNHCQEKNPDNKTNHENLQSIEKQLLNSKKDRLKSLKCIYCGGDSIMKSKLETTPLDDGTLITKKLYPCYSCGHIMEFIENISLENSS